MAKPTLAGSVGGVRKAAARHICDAGKPIKMSAICAIAAAAATSWTLVRAPRPLLVWNASASSAVGLYAIATAGELRAGDTVLAWAPATARRLAAQRNYLPANVPMVKRVGAVMGDRICAQQATISINGWLAAVRIRRDSSGRRLPWWSGCRRLRIDEFFLLSASGPLAFDGRYFGITTKDQLIGKAILLWRR